MACGGERVSICARCWMLDVDTRFVLVFAPPFQVVEWGTRVECKIPNNPVDSSRAENQTVYLVVLAPP